MNIRWMIGTDTQQVVDIDKASFPDAWSTSNLINNLRQRNCIGMVAESSTGICGTVIAGYMVYLLQPHGIELIRFAVDPEFRRSGVGRAMIEKLKNKVSAQGRKQIKLVVSERSPSAHYFFKSLGFRAVDVVRDWDDEGDGYEFRYVVNQREEDKCLTNKS